MTVDEVREGVAYVARLDDARAHVEEDVLRHKVLSAIADGTPNAADLAAEVLKTTDIVFSRWYA